ncbi:PEP/pyruvate-binding domain-containing protein [Tessaracoccus oleiagri]|uniref:Pyruvate, water dikinase n=1 Tax=Tessaracoccus oleiagri TaxID=686624 RepID=A0A1G9JG64_9ACTN|nr:PEP/pyruvate-binding domain-containing protein [Tessaracoccus oleiagri]SDL36282.1 pyruvate, water dikinase [Tessaracoccus oleiagri]
MSIGLADAGGKGANLLRLRSAGFPVPDFVIVPTDEYRAFVAEYGLAATIEGALRSDPGRASEAIRAAFRQPVPSAQRDRLLALVRPLLDGRVAVRSSATAEDLPGASFAGQQDTFLDVVGEEAVLGAVVECWSSLWTERTISYRDRNRIDHDAVALAVVVQEMVPAEASGVLFTADPLTGRRDVTVVDAVAGLGERLVSGAVVPDHFEIDASGSVVRRAPAGATPVLGDLVLRELAALGRRIESAMGGPQDVEFTVVADRLQVVQSRPVTTLYPLPVPSPRDAVWASVGAFQGMLEPITPLGRDVLQAAIGGAPPVFAAPALDHRDNHYLAAAGERLWVRIDPVLRTRIAGRLPGPIKGVDPNAAAVVAQLVESGEYRPRRANTLGLVRYLLPFVVRLLPGVLRGLRRPAAARRHVNERGRWLIDGLERRARDADGRGTPELRLAARVRAVHWFAEHAFTTMLPAFGPIMGPGIGMILVLRHLAARTGLPDADALALTGLRSLPGNVTTEMDLALWDVAKRIRANAEAREALGDPEASAARFAAGELPAVAQQGLRDFLDRYGMRGVAEIDLGVPRWRERPEEVIRTLAAYLTLEPGQAPDVLHEQGEREARAALRRLERASSPPAGRLIRFLGSRVRGLFGARETPKFVLVQCLGFLREALLRTGEDLVERGRLERAEDVFLLHLEELRDAFTLQGLAERVDERRSLRALEERRSRVPVIMVGDGRTFYDAGVPGDGDLAGLGVSPGIVEGRARVVEHPGSSALEPGEILVCRGTDPAWTPLFLTAAGLVTEVGGLMTHGSVVAREYGLPAVVGVANATEALAPGQRIRIDGTTGAITFLD